MPIGSMEDCFPGTGSYQGFRRQQRQQGPPQQPQRPPSLLIILLQQSLRSGGLQRPAGLTQLAQRITQRLAGSLQCPEEVPPHQRGLLVMMPALHCLIRPGEAQRAGRQIRTRAGWASGRLQLAGCKPHLALRCRTLRQTKHA